MSNNIAKITKIAAFVLCGVWALISLIMSIVLFSNNVVGWGFAVLFLGLILAVAQGILVYGFGQLIEHARNIDYKLNGGPAQADNMGMNPDARRVQRLNQMLSQGLISREEYDAKMMMRY